MSLKYLRLLTWLGMTALAGCGGGGGDAGTATNLPTTSYPLLAAYKASLVAGASTSYSVSGTCSGTATLSSAPTVAANFEGVAGYSSVQTTSMALNDCTPANSSTSSVDYYDANYTPLGTATVGEEYAAFKTAATALAASVRVGDSSTVGTMTLYADSTKSVTTGVRVLSYAVESDTATTAIVNFIAKDYDTANRLLSTQQVRYRLSTEGTLTASTIDVQNSTTSTTHLVFTKK